MNWLSNYVRPKIRALVAPREVPENLWHKCPSCEAMIFHREMEEDLHVCRHCGHHMRLDPEKRLSMMFDNGEYQVVELPKSLVDPLKFRDTKRYTDRLKAAQSKAQRNDAIIVAFGKMGGLDVVIAAFDFRFMGGSMGIAVGEGLVSAAKLAVLQEAPLIVVPASGGARMQEGILSLMQMPRSVIAVEIVKEAGLPYIVLLTDPTTGGVTASFAMLGDIQIAEKGAQIGFAGARVIEDTIRETLPEGFQRAEYLLEHGMVDMVVHRKDLRDTLVRVLQLLRHTGPSAEVVMLAGPDGSEVPKIGFDAGARKPEKADGAPAVLAPPGDHGQHEHRPEA
ncbi:MAG: acetyl-CoA carboxylase, carboxyltransferase subunit beta [Rhodospirillaceae bacterium]